MTADLVYIPFKRKLYNDLVRLSDGRFDPATLAEDQLMSLIERNLDDDLAYDWFGERLGELMKTYFPRSFERWEKTRAESATPTRPVSKPLVWKEITIPSGSEVRMQYGGTHHFARIENGVIRDKDGDFKPSEWASKVANGTSRNAWRDLWFKSPMERNWHPAELLRARARNHVSGGEEVGDAEN